MLSPSALPLFDAALRGVVIALLLLLAAVLSRNRPRLAMTRSGVALALGQCVQVLGATPAFELGVPRMWQAPFVAVAVGNGVLFWIFVEALFRDDFRLRPIHVIAWSAVAALAAFNCAWLAGRPTVLAPVALGLQRAVPLVFAVLAALAAVSQWREDLVEKRRRLRVFIVAAGIAYSVTMLAVRLASPSGRLTGAWATADVVILLMITLPVAWRMLGFAGSELFPAAAEPARTAVPAAVTAGDPPLDATHDPAENRLAETLQRLMTVERVYRSEELSIANLAQRMGTPEYRLRRLINQRLGHRNFSAFINGLRIEEAQSALADPSKRDLPVLTIALSAGFQSIGPFNRAFKAATGLTPSEFRKEKLADS